MGCMVNKEGKTIGEVFYLSNEEEQEIFINVFRLYLKALREEEPLGTVVSRVMDKYDGCKQLFALISVVMSMLLMESYNMLIRQIMFANPDMLRAIFRFPPM